MRSVSLGLEVVPLLFTRRLFFGPPSAQAPAWERMKHTSTRTVEVWLLLVLLLSFSDPSSSLNLAPFWIHNQGITFVVGILWYEVLSCVCGFQFKFLAISAT